ncbi:taxadiene 5-alpha hydroxylase [Gossypium australe]|uniref:Taxadiene 5-alpha hydroxylase n=1 Tax=Gossypium australe TaxID=47621 RepID=A0A5B6UVT7_9ROSI|nr:taxadiene 5-alpha hydroxylase [Gossypium australe]
MLLSMFVFEIIPHVANLGTTQTIEAGNIVYLWQSSPIIIVTKQVFRWCLLKHCMEGGVERLNRIVGPELVGETEGKVKLICERLKAASDRHKSYADLER